MNSTMLAMTTVLCLDKQQLGDIYLSSFGLYIHSSLDELDDALAS